jgi:GntR family transcriptional repressor for pyruvate dehydrogenase complex
MLIPLKQKRLTDQVADQLKEYILKSKLESSQRLPGDTELAKTFQVSVGTVREALHLLEHDGVVQIKKGPGGGIFITNSSQLKLVEKIFFSLCWDKVPFEVLIEARLAIEDRIARLAALRATKKDLKILSRTIKEMEKTINDRAMFIRKDTDFHVALAKAAKNQVLLMFMNTLKEIHNRVISYEKLDEKIFLKAVEFHWSIYMAVEKCDEEAAARTMAAHLNFFVDNYSSRYNNTPLCDLAEDASAVFE